MVYFLGITNVVVYTLLKGAVGTFSSISLGNDHSCGIDTSGSVQCWISDMFGQSTPPSGTFNAITSSLGHSCGIDSSGTAQCWGGYYTPSASTVPTNFIPGINGH